MSLLEKLSEKQAQVQADLDAWAKENLLPNQQLRCALELVEVPRTVVVIRKGGSVEDILAMPFNEFFTPDRLRASGSNYRLIYKIRLIPQEGAFCGPEDVKIRTVGDLVRCPRDKFAGYYGVGRKSFDAMAKALELVGVIWK